MSRPGRFAMSGALALSLLFGSAACLALGGCGSETGGGGEPKGQMSSDLQKSLEESAGAAQETSKQAKKK